MARRTRPRYRPNLDNIEQHRLLWDRVWQLAQDLDQEDAQCVMLDPDRDLTADELQEARQTAEELIGERTAASERDALWAAVAEALRYERLQSHANGRMTAYCTVLAIIADGISEDWPLDEVAEIWSSEIYFDTERGIYGVMMERMPVEFASFRTPKPFLKRLVNNPAHVRPRTPTDPGGAQWGLSNTE